MDILSYLPKDQFDRVMNQEMCDIEPEFMGFMEIYEPLAKLIPRWWTIVDLGCAYNPQCFYFRNHAAVISVDDNVGLERFQSPNCTIYPLRIIDFIDNVLPTLTLNLNQTFAIMSYVPCRDVEAKLARQTFPNLFAYYPCGEEAHLFKMRMLNSPSPKGPTP